MDEFLEALSENFGWIIGTKLDYNKQYENKKPLKRDVDSMADHFARTASFTATFRAEYWLNARIRRIVLVCILMLLVTNPSLKAFKEYKGREEYSGLKRKYDFFICSVYTHGNNTYLGIAGNFIDLTI